MQICNSITKWSQPAVFRLVSCGIDFVFSLNTFMFTSCWFQSWSYCHIVSETVNSITDPQMEYYISTLYSILTNFSYLIKLVKREIFHFSPCILIRRPRIIKSDSIQARPLWHFQSITRQIQKLTQKISPNPTLHQNRTIQHPTA